jgi:hypothetical protein
MMPNGELLNTISFISYSLFFPSPSLWDYSNDTTPPWTEIASRAMYTLDDCLQAGGEWYVQRLRLTPQIPPLLRT